MFDRKVLDDLRQQADLALIVGRYVSLQPSGPEWKACCPFHHETAPSFYVVPDKQMWHCFGCGEGGDAVDFIQRVLGLSFPDAVREVADITGVLLDDEPRASFRRQQRRTLHDVAQLCMDWFRSQIGGAKGYLTRRGYDGELSEAWDIGFGPKGWEVLTNHLLRKRVPLEAALDIGVLARNQNTGRYYDRFRERLIFPIHDDRGKVVAFAGRDLSGEEGVPKYVNSPEGPLYSKGKMLYGLHRALSPIRKTKQVLLVEGYTDVHAFGVAGHPEVLACCGTALTSEQARRLTRLAHRVLLAGDPDDAGVKAMSKHLPALLSAGAEVLRVPLPSDPADTLMELGPTGLAACVARATPFLRDSIVLLSSQHDATPSGRQKAADAVVPMLRATRGVQRDEVCRLAGSILGVSPRRLLYMAGGHTVEPAKATEPIRILPPAITELVWVLVHCPELIEFFKQADPAWFPVDLVPFLADLVRKTPLGTALSLAPGDLHRQLRALGADSQRYGAGQVEGVLIEGMARLELAHLDVTLGCAHNGVRFGLQLRRLELRERLSPKP